MCKKVLKKYRAAVQQVSAEQGQLQEAQVQIMVLETEKNLLEDQLSELTQRLESVEQLGDPTANSLVTRRLEFRTKELESKLELEQTTRARLEVSYILFAIPIFLRANAFKRSEYVYVQCLNNLNFIYRFSTDNWIYFTIIDIGLCRKFMLNFKEKSKTTH